MIRKLASTNQASQELVARAERGLAQLLQRSDLGFWSIIDQRQVAESCLRRANEIRAHCKQCVLIGIGGSSLGPKALHSALSQSQDFAVLENPDPRSFENLQQRFENFKDTHFIVISKSGNNLEPMALLEVVLQCGVPAKNERFTVITEDVGNPLNQWAKLYGIPRLDFP